MQRDYIRCRDFTLCKSDTTLCDSALRRAVLHKGKYSVTLVLPISDFISTFVGGYCLFS